MYRWLDKTPISRILTRFSQDISAVDSAISFLLYFALQMSLGILVTAITVVVVAGWVMLIPSFAIIEMGLLAGRIYMAAQLPAKRLKSNAKAPVISQIQATITGLGELKLPSLEPSAELYALQCPSVRMDHKIRQKQSCKHEWIHMAGLGSRFMN
jgi:ABC-type multidrug transport system fused ATPase/permease subunit